MIGLLLNALVPVFFTLLLGWFAGRRNIIDNRNLAGINVMLMNFALPAALFVAMARIPLAQFRAEGLLGGCMCVSMLAVYGITWYLQIRIFHRSRPAGAVQALTVAFPNCAAVGLALLPPIFGPASAAVAGIGIAAGAIVISPLTIAVLESQNAPDSLTPKLSFPAAVGLSFTKPVVFAPIAGLALALSGIGLHELAGRTLLLLGQGAAGVALFLTGLILSAQSFRFTADVGWGVLLKNILQPVLMFVLLRGLHVATALSAEAVLLMAVPAGFFGTVFGARFDVDAPEASATLIASTLLSVATLSLAIFLLRVPH